MTTKDPLLSLLKVPVVRKVIRHLGSFYTEGSVVTIKRGHLAGMKWRRFHRHVNGYWAGIYEMVLQDLLAHELREGSVFYDVGANAGFFSLLAARLVGSSGCVYSFEPVEENAVDIESQMILNGIHNCEVHRIALSNKPGILQMHTGPNSSMGRIVTSEEAKQSAAPLLSVDVTTLDSFAPKHRPPDLIKIDVEGEEANVLDGARSILNLPQAPTLVIELHGETVGRAVAEILRSYGYRLMDLVEKSLVDSTQVPSHLFAKK